MQGAYSDDVLATVLANCNGNLSAAVETLLSFSVSPSTLDKPECSGTDIACDDGVANPSVEASSSCATVRSSGAIGKSLWETLPQDCRAAVTALLSSRDLGRAARVSQEFADYARTRRQNAQFVRAPGGLSFTAVAAMLASHPSASKV